MLNNRIKQNVDELLEKESSARLLKLSIKELKYEKSSAWQYITSLIIACTLGMCIGLSEETVLVMKNVAEVFNGVEIAFIAMIIGSYSIFQALLSDDFLMALIDTENNLLKISNKSFFNLVILYLFGILTNVILLVFFSIINEHWVLFEGKYWLNNSIAVLLCMVYLFYNTMIILEVKNFATNLYRMFNASNSQRIINILSDIDEREEK